MGMVGNWYLQKAERLGKGIPANCGESSAGETSRLHRCQRGVGAGESSLRDLLIESLRIRVRSKSCNKLIACLVM
jgi:hypothetical protein